jgi:ribonuclease J
MNEQTNNKPPHHRPQRPGGGRSQQGGGNRRPTSKPGMASRGDAIRAQKRAVDMAHRLANEFADAAGNQAPRSEPRRANQIAEDFEKLKVVILGGLNDVGEKNMMVIEYKNDALIIDCGNDLSVDLPGVNYAVNDPTYLESIKNKIRGYVISHGHLDHIGGLRHIAPKFPAPIYGSRFSIGMVEMTFENAAADTGLSFKPETVVMNMDGHERLKVGEFVIELARITHSIPEASVVIIDTPVGRILNTGDFRLDPEPLDQLPSDIERLKKAGEEGVLLLLSDSTNSDQHGRTPTEHTLQQSFHDVIKGAPGRVFVSIFSSNMNRIQMIVNSGVSAGRRIAIDGRSMMSYSEIAVRQGILKIPQGSVLPMREMPNMPDDKVLVICTGGQGEPGAALQRMSEGEHKHIKLKSGDTVVISSTPIPGNEVRYDMISNNLASRGVRLYRAPTHELDGCGPLHVSGHANRDEHREMIEMVKPKYVLPIHAGALRRRYHGDVAIESGMKRENVLLPNNGDVLLFSNDKYEQGGTVPNGAWLVDQTGNLVSNVVVKDRLVLAEHGLVVVILTVDKKTGGLLTSPDIVTRGFIYIRDSEELMNEFRAELRRAVAQRFKRVDIERFKAEIRDHVTHFLYDKTQRSPIVIPVVNVIGGRTEKFTVEQSANGINPPAKSEEDAKLEQQKRFQEMRARLLGADQPD